MAGLFSGTTWDSPEPLPQPIVACLEKHGGIKFDQTNGSITYFFTSSVKKEWPGTNKNTIDWVLANYKAGIVQEYLFSVFANILTLEPGIIHVTQP
jgi:hypothetical protein